MLDWRECSNDKEKYCLYLASREWAVKKEAVKNRSGNICERCKRNRSYAVHHSTYVRKYDERLDDLIDLCDNCHKYIHAKSDFDPAVVESTNLDFYQLFDNKCVEAFLGKCSIEELIKLGAEETCKKDDLSVASFILGRVSAISLYRDRIACNPHIATNPVKKITGAIFKDTGYYEDSEIIKNQMANTKTIQQFIDECLEIGEEFSILGNDLKNAYLAWIKKQGIEIKRWKYDLVIQKIRLLIPTKRWDNNKKQHLGIRLKMPTENELNVNI